MSKWQGDVDWTKVKGSGVSFAFIKATEGKDRLDAKFNEYWQRARAVGLPYAPYHFYYFCSTPDDQADWFIRNVPKSAALLPPVLDAALNFDRDLLVPKSGDVHPAAPADAGSRSPNRLPGGTILAGPPSFPRLAASI